MERTSISLRLDHGGISYEGWATPSKELHADGRSASYHVVLNGNFFGDMSFANGKWLISEQRPAELTGAVGQALADALEKAPAAPLEKPGKEKTGNRDELTSKD